MRFKTYLATYILFLSMLFSCFGIVSAYMTKNQINMYSEKCAREFDTIAHTLFRDISLISGRGNIQSNEIPPNRFIYERSGGEFIYVLSYHVLRRV